MAVAAAMGMQALSTYQKMKATSAQADYEAGLATQNAKIAQAQTASAGQAGSYKQAQILQQGSAFAGTQKAAMSANGLDIQAGTPLDTLSATARGVQQDASMERYNTELQMWGLNTQANQYFDQAANIKTAAKNKNAATLLSGISSIVSQYSTMNDGGAGNEAGKASTASPATTYGIKLYPTTSLWSNSSSTSKLWSPYQG